MNQVSISNLKPMKAVEIKAALPFEVTADGVVVAVMGKPGQIPKVLARQTQCPNCKMVYNVTEPDGRPGFFTIKHPKG